MKRGGCKQTAPQPVGAGLCPHRSWGGLRSPPWEGDGARDPIALGGDVWWCNSYGRKGRGGLGRLPGVCVCGAALGCEIPLGLQRYLCPAAGACAGIWHLPHPPAWALCIRIKPCPPLQGPHGRDPHPSRPSPHHQAPLSAPWPGARGLGLLQGPCPSGDALGSR